MPGALDTIQEILTGMIHGTQMHAELQRSQDEHDAMQRQAVQQDRNNRIQDIQQQMLLQNNARPVSDAGTVQGDPVSIPSILSNMTQNATPGIDGDGNPLAPLGQLGGPLATIQTMLPGGIRKADPTRTLPYKTQDGKTIGWEFLNPKEIDDRAARGKQAEIQAGMVDVAVPPTLQRFFGGTKTLKVAPAGASSLMDQMMQRARSLEIEDVTPEDQKRFGLPAQVRGDVFDKAKELSAAGAVKNDSPKSPTATSLAVTATSPTATPEQKAGAEAALQRMKSQLAGARKSTTAATATTPQPDMGKPGATGEEFLASLPTGQQSRVKAIAEGREAPLTGLGATKGEGAALMRAVEQYDPTWSKERAQLRKAFTTGPDARNIGALNTATVHLDQLHEAAKAMQNGTWQPGNAVYNYVAEKFGKSAPTNYKYVMNALAGETASALKGNATDPEIAKVTESLSRDLSPEQALGIAESGLHVMGAKLNTFDERYHQQSPNDPWSPVLPSARAVYSKYGVQPTSKNSGGVKVDGTYNPKTGKIE